MGSGWVRLGLAALWAGGLWGGIGGTVALPAGTLANSVAVDSAGYVYVAGFYAVNPSDSGSIMHAFAAKMSADGSQRVWMTRFAGSKDDRAVALALGADGSVYVTGNTSSTDFPVTQGAMQQTPANAFAAKLDARGNVVWASYLPGDTGQAIAVDAAGHAFVTGHLAFSPAFPATPGAVSGAVSKSAETGYIIELDPAGSSAVLAIAGFGGMGIALDGQGDIYAVGQFAGPLAPTTIGAFQTSSATQVCDSLGFFGAFPCEYQHVAKIDPSGRQLLAATYVAGTWGATPAGLAVAQDGGVILAGTTSSSDYPTTPRAWQPEYFPNPAARFTPPADSYPPPNSGYVSKLSADLSRILWSTYLGGSGGPQPYSLALGDSITGLAVDAAGNVVVAGFANSQDFPGLWNTPVAQRPVVPANGQNAAAFVARLSGDGVQLSPVQLVSGLLRDLGDPSGGSVAVRADGSAVTVGSQVVGVSFGGVGRVAAICDNADNAKIVAVAPGQLVTLYGTKLAPEGHAAAGNGFLPTALNGVTVTFNGIAAPILYTSDIQINLQVPYEIAGAAEVAMQVSSQMVSPAVSESYILAVQERRPSVFLTDAAFAQPIFDVAVCGTQSFGALQPVAFNADGTQNSCANPAAPGSTVTVLVNGLGASSPALETGEVSTEAEAVSPPAAVLGSGGSMSVPTATLPGSVVGMAQVQIPAGLKSTVWDVQIADPAVLGYRVRGPGVVIWVAQ